MDDLTTKSEASAGRAASAVERIVTPELDIGTYPPPEHVWTCFHCGETFHSVGSARDHFGAAQDSMPGCVIKVELGGERGLLMALRKAEAQIARHMAEDTDIHRWAISIQSKHSDALRDAEDAGFARGLTSAKKHPD